jgi:peptide/nickel transport system substrate-binding protein
MVILNLKTQYRGGEEKMEDLLNKLKSLKQRDAIIAILVIFTFIMFFFSKVDNARGADEYEHIKIGLYTKLAGVDPLGYPRLNRPELNVQMCFFDHLFRRDDNGKIVGHLAEEYEWIDQNTFRIKLRQGVKFHNGDEFTAEDVKWSIEDMKNPDRGPGLAAIVKPIKEVKILDNYTVDLLTEFPVPTLPAKLACYTLMVSSKERSTKSPEEYENKPMGTGPFKFVEWEKGKHIIAVRNENYFMGVPKIKKITFFPIPDHNTRVSALKAGDIDIAMDIPPSQAKAMKNVSGIEVTATPSSRIEFVGIRTDVKPFDDVRFRQALNYAVNKEEFTRTMLEGYGLPIGQPCPPYFFGHNPNISVFKYDPEKARQLLSEIGLPKDFTVFFSVATIFEEKARAVAGYLEAVGLRVKLEIKELSSAYADFLQRKVKPLYYYSWGNWSLLDIDGTLTDVFGCTNKEKGTGRWSYYCNPHIEEIIKEMRTIDKEKRLADSHEASKILREDAPAIYLYAQYDIHAKREGIPEFKARHDNTIRLKWIKGGGEY